MRSVMNGDVIFVRIASFDSAILKLSLNRMHGMPGYICCDTSIQFSQQSMFRSLKNYSYYGFVL